MKSIEEIKKLTALFEKGAISKEEYDDLLINILGLSKQKQEKSEPPITPQAEPMDLDSAMENQRLAIYRSFRIDSRHKFNRVHKNISDAGSKVRSSVKWAVFNQLLLFIGTGGLYYGYFDYLITILSSSKDYEDSITIMVISGLILIASFICWINQLVKLNKAGKIMQLSKDLIEI